MTLQELAGVLAGLTPKRSTGISEGSGAVTKQYVSLRRKSKKSP